MRYEKGQKEKTREHIIGVAAARFRKEGVAQVGVASLMESAGLTHGGFYAHFSSKDDLVANTLQLTGERTRERWGKTLADEGIAALIRWYLSPDHRDHPENGCVGSCLATEIGRGADGPRQTFTENIRKMIDLLEPYVGLSKPEGERRTVAMQVYGLMVGTLQLARAITDIELSDQMLAAAMDAALKMAE